MHSGDVGICDEAVIEIVPAVVGSRDVEIVEDIMVPEELVAVVRCLRYTICCLFNFPFRISPWTHTCQEMLRPL